MSGNKNILIVGDIHAKSKFILPRIDQAIKVYDINKVIFMGDYYDEWAVEDTFICEGIDKLIEWKLETNDNGIETIFLSGNHDYAYFNPVSHQCSGHRYDLTNSARRNLIEFLDIRIADTVNDYLLTHSGINMSWANAFLPEEIKTKNPQKIADKLNNIFDEAKKIAKEIIPGSDGNWIPYAQDVDSPLNCLEYCGIFRGGRAPYSGPLWTDATELALDPARDINQIVAHTPLRTCANGKKLFKKETFATDEKLKSNFDSVKTWFCDTFSLTNKLKPGGDGSMLLVKGKNEPIIIGNKEDKNIDSYTVHFCYNDIEPWQSEQLHLFDNQTS